VLHHGTYLAQRWDEESGANFVEVGIDDGRGQVVVLRSFVSSGPLEGYVHGVRLPEE